VSETPLLRPTSKFVDEGKASVSLPGVRKVRRRMFRRLNSCAVPGFAPLCLDSNDPETVECAFRQRLLRDVPPFDKAKLAKFKLFVRQFLRTNVAKARILEFEEWLESTSYDVARKDQLREAYRELKGGRPTRHQASHIDTFVKSESYPTWKHARMINSRADAFKVWSGPRFKAIEEVVYQLPEFIKHVPVCKRPKVIRNLRKAGRHYYATDFTAFESHFVPEFLDACECELYRWCLSEDSDAEFLCSVLMGKNAMRTRTGVRAEVLGRRMSGDMCTSLGNGFSNLMLAKFIVAEKHGELCGFVEGDDGLFATDIALTAADYAQLGFTIKIEEVLDPCEASFCGMIFSDSMEIIRDPKRFLMGFGWTHSVLGGGSRVMDELLRAKALSCVYETPQCPIVGAFARYALRSTSYVSPRFVRDGWHEKLPDVIDVPDFAPAIATRQLFSVMYGIPISVQLEIERAASCGDMLLVASLISPVGEVSDYFGKYVTIT
jgi:hypothetical protein